MSQAWVIRAGRHGERDAWALQSGCSGGGWAEVPDLTECSTREAVGQVIAKTYAGKTYATISNFSHGGIEVVGASTFTLTLDVYGDYIPEQDTRVATARALRD